MTREDVEAMNAILRLPPDAQVWQMQQSRRKPAFKSASVTTKSDNNHRNLCTRCGSAGHDAVICPFAPRNLLAPSF